jgi:3',5'-cyclic AMP phosphodiesterase CpdA
MRRIAHLSDLHFGTETSGVLTELGSSLMRFAPHLVVVTGDLTQRARSSQFRCARRFLDELPFARLVVPGNHDIEPLYRPLHRALAPYSRYKRFITPELCPVWHDDGLLVLGLSSVQPWRWKEGTLSLQQLNQMKETAQRYPSTLRILAAHHPIVQAATTRPTRRLSRHDELFSALEAADIGVCLSGHLHQSFSGLAIHPLELPRSVLAVHASTATSTRLRGHANAYNQLTIEGSTLQIAATAWDGQAFEPLSRIQYERRQGTWHVLASADAERSLPKVQPPVLDR